MNERTTDDSPFGPTATTLYLLSSLSPLLIAILVPVLLRFPTTEPLLESTISTLSAVPVLVRVTVTSVVLSPSIVTPAVADPPIWSPSPSTNVPITAARMTVIATINMTPITGLTPRSSSLNSLPSFMFEPSRVRSVRSWNNYGPRLSGYWLLQNEQILYKYLLAYLSVLKIGSARSSRKCSLLNV